LTPPEPNQNTETAEQQIRTYQRQLRRLASELSLAEARERRAIASDLHDHIGQALVYVSQKVSVLQGNAVFSGMESEFSEILSILLQTIKYTRNLTVEISPPILYEFGLAAAIDWLAERTKERHGLKVVSKQSGTPREVTEDIRVFVFKAVQELILNAVKHAETDTVKVSINWGKETVKVTVNDNGKGFDVAACESGYATSDCFGLFSIKERLSFIGGNLAIDSTPGRGTQVEITAPYELRSDGDD